MRNWECIRLFGANRNPLPDLSSLDKDIDKLVDLLCDTGNRGFWKLIPAGYTYFGQFIDHDLTLILENSLAPEPNKPLQLNEITLGRNPALDLDSLYGGGLSDSVIPFDKTNGMFILGDPDPGNPRFNDLPRDSRLKPLIGDARNDENLLVGQMQVLFMKLHNRIITDLQNNDPGKDVYALFKEAQEEVIKIYQYLVIHDFAKQILNINVHEKVLLGGAGDLGQLNNSDRKLTLEFASAAFRLHSMVKPEYHLNNKRKVKLKALLEITRRRRKYKDPHTSAQLLGPDDFVDWGFFFKFKNYPTFSQQCQFAQAISYTLQQDLLELDIPGHGRINMVDRTIRRGFHHDLCSGQEIYAQLISKFGDFAKKELRMSTADLTLLADLSNTNSVKPHTPLWAYLMIEADKKLGIMGSWIVAETLKSAARNAEIQLPDLFNTKNKHIYPPLLKLTQIQGRETFSIEDVIFYIYAAPNTDIDALVLTTQKERKMANTYEDWFGIAEVGAVSVFKKGNSDDPSAKVPDSVLKELESYLPKARSDSQQEQHLVARIPSEHDGKDVLKLYVNQTWQDDVYREFNKLNFVNLEGALDRAYYNNYAGVEALRSIEKFKLDAGEWESDSPVLLLKNVPGDGKFTVRIEFTNKASGDAIDAYWCWP